MSSHATHQRQHPGLDPDVVSWRRARLLRHGFPADLAGRVGADPGFDLHFVIDLVERGCPPELAVRIAAPLDAAEGR